MKNKLLITLESSVGKKETPIELKLHKDNQSMLHLSPKILDLFFLGDAIFEIEKILSPNSAEYLPKIKKISIPHISDLNDKDKSELSILLNQLFLFLYKKDLIFDFVKAGFQAPDKASLNINTDYDSVMLFSGGLDSSLGLNYCKAKFNKTLLIYIRHGNAGQLTPTINKLEETLILPKGFKLVRIAGPKQESGYFANTRGLLYLLTGALYACENNSPLIISECGVTMYQPRFGPLYSVTHTTDPVVIRIGKELIKIITKKDIDIKLPFENNTKAEMVKLYGDQENIAHSFSCLSNLRFAVAKGNCGECYACLVRRLGILAARNDPTIYSQKNKLADIKHIKEKLYPIVNFCYRVVTDFDNLDYWQKEKILKYKKRDLFNRFALDTFIALDNLSKNKELPDWANLYLDAIDKSALQERLLELKKLENGAS